MPTSSLTLQEQEELLRLIQKIVADKGFVPDSCYELLYSLNRRAIVEVLIHDANGRYILKHRRDQHFVGWHVPGGEIRTKETLEAACDRHVKMDGVAQGVTNIRAIAVHPYAEGEHPYGYPFIVLVACEAVGPVTEREDCMWFDSPPPDLIKNAPHGRYLEVFQEWFRGDRERAARIF